MKRGLAIMSLVIATLLAAALAASAQDTTGSTNPAAPKRLENQIRPNLEISIPTLQFSDITVTQQGDKSRLSVSFLAQYLAAVYKYGVAIAGVVAAVMAMIGGLQYLTAGGDAGRVGAAKTRITNAVIGLSLALGSYLVLATINQDIVAFKSFDLEQTKKIDFTSELNGSLVTGDFSSGGGDPGQYGPIADRLATTLGINACLWKSQIGKESGWNPRAKSACCYGLGQIDAKYVADVAGRIGILNRNRAQIVSLHSQKCPTCPGPNASEEQVGQWMLSDPEGNLIISGIIRQGLKNATPNPVATTMAYGMGTGSYRSFLTNAGCSPESFSEDQLIANLKAGADPEAILKKSCPPPVTWPLARPDWDCPGSWKCCASLTGTCEQPAPWVVDGKSRGRRGVCQGGKRNGQTCFAVAGAEKYARDWISKIKQQCAK